MRLTTRVLSTTLLALAVAVPAAQADDDKSRRANASYRGMDRNGDGVITQREWQGNAVSFRNHDRNGDGVLTGREIGLTAGARTRHPLDVNGDGVVSRAEQARRTANVRRPANLTREQYFRMLDENRNGVLSPWEWDDENISHAYADVNRDGVVSWNEWANTRQGNRSDRGYYADQYRADPYRDDRYRDDRRVVDDRRLNEFLRSDRNSDEYLTRDEWQGTEWSFQHHDRNDDGRVHVNEYLQG